MLSLTDLSKKDAKFDWTFSCDSAFKALKRALTTAPVLAFPDIDKPFELVCDASGIGLGAVLLQEGRPLAYYSRKMTAAECNYIVTEQELLATVDALCVFRCYLLSGKQFNLVTDNQPNTFLQTQPLLSILGLLSQPDQLARQVATSSLLQTTGLLSFRTLLHPTGCALLSFALGTF